MPADDPEPTIPPQFAAALRDRYEILRETGSGGSATVYLARDRKHGRLVALKALDPDLGSSASERFLREIQLVAGMQHPHILPMYDSGVADGRLYFVMPFVDGGSLRERLAAGRMPLDEALRCAGDVALALAFAHEQGVVHRDVKPENILFYHGQACLADFGVARAMEQLGPNVTGHGVIVGTPAYMSPEQVSFAGFDGRSDVYSLACVLYEALAGIPAFSGTTPQQLLQQRLRCPPGSIRALRADVPPAVDALLTRALATSPDDRFPSARSFALAIEHALRDLGRPVRRVSGPKDAARLLHVLARHRAASSAAGVAVLALALLALSPRLRLSWPRKAVAGEPVSAQAAFESARRAMSVWDLAGAERDLVVAVTADPGFAPAQLWLAETFALRRRVSADQFRLAAARLGAARRALHGRDSLLAEGLIALAGRNYPAACATYERLRAADSLDALAWYGLGDCLALDSAVVRDPRSPSGWRFRAGRDGAVRAYFRAAAIDPALHNALPYALFTALLPTVPVQVRTGHSEREGATPARAFAAYPSLDGDTVAYVPYPLAAFPTPATLPRALQHDRDRLLSFARTWVAVDPTSADAHEALTLAREARSELGTDDDGALGALRQARELARAPAQRVRLAALAVRLRLERGELDSARALADSLLDDWAAARSSVEVASQLVGLAALTGRVRRAGELLAVVTAPDNATAGIAPPLTEVASRLFARAASGACDDSLGVLRAQVERLLESYSQPALLPERRRQLLARPAALAFPCLGARGLAGLAPVLPLDRAQRSAAAGDRRRALAVLDSLQAERRVMRPGDVALDHTVQEAWLRASLGDTAAAARQLDLVLDALPTLGTWSVREPAQAAAVGRALLLRAELADARGDRDTARRRAAQALVLWRHADAALAPTVARLRTLAGQ